MIPELFRIGPVTVHSFGATLAVTFLVVAWLLAREFTRRGFTADDAWSVTLAAMIGGMVGAKLWFVLDNWAEAVETPRRIILSGSGLTYYGGLLGGAIGVIWQSRRRGVPLATMADVGGPLILLGYGLGRIGCFLNGDDYGTPSDLPWAMAFPEGSPPTSERVHPTQLYETAASLLLFAGLWGARGRLGRYPGLTMGLYMVLAGLERFLVEFVRLNEPVLLGCTLAQLVSLGLIAGGGILILRVRSR
jgi:phosphatidylglycerol:prolipoprotein diacylglycerol transferase